MRELVYRHDRGKGLIMTVSRGETAQYVAAHSKELARLSRKAGLDGLAHVLEIAALEARDISEHAQEPRRRTH